APEAVGRPLSFLEACAFQWINPKAWSLAAGVAAGFMTGGAPAAEAAAIGGIFLISGLTSAHAWAGFGAALRGWLGQGARLRLFNRLMGAALALFVVALIVD
ncbi:MAG: LysE family translocator, partial [Pseudomonadota bacterium]